VKELEQLVQSLEVRKRIKDGHAESPPFSNFFTFPQYTSNNSQLVPPNGSSSDAIADIEVTMVDSHANLRILSQRRPKQLLKMLMGLQSLRLSTLHINLTTTVDNMVLYSFSLKVNNCILIITDILASIFLKYPCLKNNLLKIICMCLTSTRFYRCCNRFMSDL
jgi:hypothetical protein